MNEETLARAREFAEGLWGRLPKLSSDVLGEDVTISKMKLVEEWVDHSNQYVASLHVEGPHEAHLFLVFDVELSIAFGGLLVMMQEKAIREKMVRKEMTEDDYDAMGECVNQMSSVINETLKEVLGEGFHARFVQGVVGENPELASYQDQAMARATGKLKVGSLHEGKFQVIIPERMLTGEEEGQGATDGFELSAEELEALREATKDGFRAVCDSIVLLLAVDREQETWTKTLEETGLEINVARNIFDVRRYARDGQCGVVMVDADASPSGGLPALAAIRGARDIEAPVIVAASEPTRPHVISCMAAGAITYMVKPLDVTVLKDRLEKAVADWHDREARP